MPMDKLKSKVVNLLRWSEQYTKTDMVYLVKEGGWLSFAKGFEIAAGTLLAIAFANLVPQEVYGNYKFVVSAAGIIGAFTLTGMGTAITQSVARGYDGALKQGFKETLKWSVGIIVVALGAAGYYYLQGNSTLAIGMLLIAVSQPILKSSKLFEGFLEGKKDFKTQSFYLSIWEAVEVAALILTLFLTDNVLIILGVFFAANAILPLLLYQLTLTNYQPDNKSNSETLTFGKHLSVMQILSQIAKHIDKVLVFHFLGAAELAIYSFAVLPVQKMGMGRGIIGSLALPKFSDTDMPTLKRTLPRKVLIFFGACLVVVLAFILSAPYIYDLVFPQYVESVRYAQMFSLSILLFPATLFGQSLKGHARTKELYISSVGTNILKIVLLLILLPPFGLWGAIYVLLIERSAKLVLNGYLFAKQ